MRFWVALVVCASMLGGCAPEETAHEQAPEPRTTLEEGANHPAAPASLEPLPARFAGVLPCADCPGIRYEIDLRPANVYFLRMTYMSATPERSYDDIGSWSIASDLRTLALRGSRQAPILFSILDATTLQRLDSEGQPIESELSYDLKRESTYEALSPLVPLRGMYQQTDSGAVVQECSTGLALRLEGEVTTTLAEQFAALRTPQGRAVLLAVEGRIHVPVEDPTRATLAATSTARFWPGESCGARGVTHELEGSRWVLVRLKDEPVQVLENRPEPYIVLQSSTKQLAGHGGCNRLSGGYSIDGDRIDFNEVMTTRTACPELDTEHAFLNALEAAVRWRLEDNQLVLLDAKGVSVVRLESRNL